MYGYDVSFSELFVFQFVVMPGDYNKALFAVVAIGAPFFALILYGACFVCWVLCSCRDSSDIDYEPASSLAARKSQFLFLS